MSEIKKVLRKIYGSQCDQVGSELDNFENLIDYPKGDMMKVTISYRDPASAINPKELVDIPALLNENGIAYVTFENLQVIQHFQVLSSWDTNDMWDDTDFIIFQELYDLYYEGIGSKAKELEEDEVYLKELNETTIKSITQFSEFENVYEIEGDWFADVVFYVGNVRGCLYNVPVQTKNGKNVKVGKEVLGVILGFRASFTRHAIDLQSTRDYNVLFDTMEDCLIAEDSLDAYVALAEDSMKNK